MGDWGSGNRPWLAVVFATAAAWLAVGAVACFGAWPAGERATVAFQDTAKRRGASALWGGVACATPRRARVLKHRGDPHGTARGRPQGNDRFRRLTVIDGDDVYGERCELGHNDRLTGPTVLYEEGDRRLTFVSLRLTRSYPLGAERWQVVMQMKQTQPAENGGGTPVLALEARDRRWRLMQSTSRLDSSDTRQLWSAPAHRGVWTRFAFDIVYSQERSGGSIKLYVDLNDDGDVADPKEESRSIRAYTLKRETAGGDESDGIAPGESIPSHLRLGVYHHPDIACPPPRGCSVDIDNVQVLAF